MAEWRLTITIVSTSWDRLKSGASFAERTVAAAKSFKSIPLKVGGSGGSDESFTHISFAVESPIPAQVKALRDEADRLERGEME
jgi:hypothetical protein